MGSDERGKNDEHQEGKGGETKLLRRGQQGTRNLFDHVSRGESPTLRILLSRRNADEVSWNHLSADERTQFSKATETERQGAYDFKAVTIIDLAESDLIAHCSGLEGDRYWLQGQGQIVRAWFQGS